VRENLRIGMRMARAGYRAEAEMAFQEALAQDPTNETALLWLGYLSEEYKASLKYISRALEFHPQSARAYTALQWAWRRAAGATYASSPPFSISSRWQTNHRDPPTNQVLHNPSSVRPRPMYTFAPLVTIACLMLIIIGWTVGMAFLPHLPAISARGFSSSSPLMPVNLPAEPTPPNGESLARQAAASMMLPPLTTTPTPTPTPHPDTTGIPAPTSTPTITPSPTMLPIGAEMVVPEPFPIPGPRQYVPSTTLMIPTPVQPVPVAADAVNIVVLGSDKRDDWTEWHTDVVQVVSIQRNRGVVSVISVPRDLYVYIPGMWMSRINFADYYGEAYGYEGGGPALVRDTLLYNLGIRMDHYVRTNFDGLIGIVDTMGGVDIPVHCYLSDYWPYPDDNGVYPILEMQPGIQHMDGETALWYARSRKTTSVFSRERRQQQVLQAIWHKARDAGMLTRAPTLWRQGQEMVQTDLNIGEILDLARLALTLDDRNVRFYNIGADAVTPWTTPYGGAVFLPQWEKIKPIIAEAMAPPKKARLNRTYMTVEVWNGTPNEGWGWLAADRLYRAGFPAYVSEADRTDYEQTQLIIFSSSLKGSGADHLQELFGLSDEQVIHQPDESSPYGFRLILGSDYQTCPYSQ